VCAELLWRQIFPGPGAARCGGQSSGRDRVHRRRRPGGGADLDDGDSRPRLRRGGAAPRNPSLAAVTAPCPVAYITSKWALRGLSQVASMELVPSNIRVNSIHPGFIETPMTASASPAFLAASLSQTPLSRAGQPEEVAALVTFLLSAAAAYITVAEIPVDGGQPGHGGAKAISDALRVTT